MTTAWNLISNLLSTHGSATTRSGLWHLQAGTAAAPALDVVDAWREATGRGVNVAIFDDGADHATAVTGIIGARPSSAAPIGVAYNANLSAFTVVGQSMTAITNTMWQAQNYDVTNNSWGWNYAFYANRLSTSFSSFFDAIANAADHGRSGLGTVQVVAGGNSRATGGDTNLSNFTNDRHVIAVGAVTSEGGVASYSNPGASLLVSAPSSGGTRGITTTDLPGSAGYSATDVTDSFGGTSAAAPQVSGTVALMLEANPYLGWRDVRTILAMTAEQPTGIATTTNGAANWNGGGMHFSNDTGFGVVDARAAVRLAETWTAQSTSANELNLSVSSNQTQVLRANGSISYSFNVTSAIDLENVEVQLSGNHSRASDLVVQLVSPDGTTSYLLNHSGGSVALSTFTLSSNAFLGEDGAGQWTLRVSEGSGAVAGTFLGATLSLHGSDPATSDDVFVYTDAFGSLSDGNRGVLHTTSGHGVINAAATTSNDIIDLHAGATSTIAGRGLYLTSDSIVNTAVAGDGNVKLIANDHGNVLVGGHGNDIFVGGTGNDTFVSGSGHYNVMNGGAGTDTVVEAGNLSAWTVARTGGGWTLTNNASGQVDALTGIERVQFNDQTILLDMDDHTGAAFRLYGAAFNRAPDMTGLDYWTARLDQGTSVHDIAQAFIDSPEFGMHYGTNVSNSAFVESLYENALGRHSDSVGSVRWNALLDQHLLDRADVLSQFAASPENLQNHLVAGQHGAVLSV